MAFCGAARAQTDEDAPWLRDLLASQGDLLQDGWEGYANYRLPALAATPEGVVMVFCEGRKTGHADSGDIDLVMKRSTDGGRNWEPLRLIHEEGGNAAITIGNPAPVYDARENRLFVFFCRNNSGVLVTWSEDQGETWADPIDLTDGLKRSDWSYYATGPGHGIQTSSGRLIVPCAHVDGGGSARSHLLISDDGGRNWRIGPTIGAATRECMVAEVEPGLLYLNMRTLTQDRRRVTAWSRDDGDTWSATEFEKELTGPSCQGSLVAATAKDGRRLHFYAGPSGSDRAILHVYKSEDGCQTWNRGRILSDGSVGYSDLLVLPNGDVGCVYEREYCRRIIFARFPPTALDHCEFYGDLASRSFPSNPSLTSLQNPWGEDLFCADPIPPDFNLRVAIAAAVYSAQGVRFDGYLGSDDDGMHYAAAADGQDGAFIGDGDLQGYRVVEDGRPDDLGERFWVCLDYPIHALGLAGFPIREAMIDDFNSARAEYTNNGYFPQNEPNSHWFFRRVPNLRRYLSRAQVYHNDEITTAQYRDPNFRPVAPFEIGDLVLFGHLRDNDGLSVFYPKHSGIVASVDHRGLPYQVYNMRVNHKLIDEVDGLIRQTRNIDGSAVYFERFLDRYTISGHGRIVNSFRSRNRPPRYLVAMDSACDPDEIDLGEWRRNPVVQVWRRLLSPVFQPALTLRDAVRAEVSEADPPAGTEQAAGAGDS